MVINNLWYFDKGIEDVELIKVKLINLAYKLTIQYSHTHRIYYISFKKDINS